MQITNLKISNYCGLRHLDVKLQKPVLLVWDELQRIKSECGYGNTDAIEIYPADDDVVNVANMRHLWILDSRIPFAWRKQK